MHFLFLTPVEYHLIGMKSHVFFSIVSHLESKSTIQAKRVLEIGSFCGVGALPALLAGGIFTWVFQEPTIKNRSCLGV